MHVEPHPVFPCMLRGTTSGCCCRGGVEMAPSYYLCSEWVEGPMKPAL